MIIDRLIINILIIYRLKIDRFIIDRKIIDRLIIKMIIEMIVHMIESQSDMIIEYWMDRKNYLPFHGSRYKATHPRLLTIISIRATIREVVTTNRL